MVKEFALGLDALVPSAFQTQTLPVRLRTASLLRGHTASPYMSSVLVENHGDDLSCRAAFESKLCVDNLVKERVLGVREN